MKSELEELREKNKEVVEDLNERISDLEYEVSVLEEEVSVLEEECEDNEDYIFPHDTINDQMKAELILKNWDSITLDLIEGIIPEKFAYKS